MEAEMPDPVSQTSERQSGLPIGIPLAALIAIAFLFGSTIFNSAQKSFDVAGPPRSTESQTN
jgi:hypothetical protein